MHIMQTVFASYYCKPHRHYNGYVESAHEARSMFSNGHSGANVFNVAMCMSFSTNRRRSGSVYVIRRRR